MRILFIALALILSTVDAAASSYRPSTRTTTTTRTYTFKPTYTPTTYVPTTHVYIPPPMPSVHVYSPGALAYTTYRPVTYSSGGSFSSKSLLIVVGIVVSVILCIVLCAFCSKHNDDEGVH